MKKILALVVLLAILATTAASAAEIDLAGMTFDELRELQQKVSAEIIKRPEWKEVVVPAGEWIVGEDIPAGSYSVKIHPTESSTYVKIWGHAIDDYSAGGGLVYDFIVKQERPVFGKVNLRAGYVVDIDEPVIFAPAVSLGF